MYDPAIFPQLKQCFAFLTKSPRGNIVKGIGVSIEINVTGFLEIQDKKLTKIEENEIYIFLFLEARLLIVSFQSLRSGRWYIIHFPDSRRTRPKTSKVCPSCVYVLCRLRNSSHDPSFLTGSNSSWWFSQMTSWTSSILRLTDSSWKSSSATILSCR